MGAALKGTVDRRRYVDDATGYAILTIRPTRAAGNDNDKGARKPGGGVITIKGRGLAGFMPGQGITAIGHWIEDKRYGRQFMVHSADETIPDDNEGMAKWLDDVGVKGIGPVTANRLANAFGADTIERIAEGDPDARLILGSRFEEAQRSMMERWGERKFGPLLAGYDIGPSIRKKVYEKYGARTEQVVTLEPYRLIQEIDGIAFSTADKIAHATGTATQDRARIVAAAYDCLRTAANDGSTALSRSMLAQKTRILSGVDVEEVDAALDHMGDGVAETVVVVDGQVEQGWALRDLDQAEHRFAQALIRKNAGQPWLSAEQALHFVTQAVELINAGKPRDRWVEPNAEQHASALMALTSGLSIVTGGPGTGKTFTLNIIVKAWKLASRRGLVPQTVLLGAPTGKAAQRMKEATGVAAKTLHRLLEAGSEGFRRNEGNPLDDGFVAIDESSMKDIWLALALSRAWGRCPVLLIGDPDQLASVGPGRVLGDLIDSGVVPVTRLIQVRRQAEGSAIAEGAQAIREGRMPAMDTTGEGDFVFFEMDESGDDDEASATAEAAETAAMLHAAYVKAGMDVQLLTPGHKADTGTVAMNEVLQEAAGLEGPHVDIGGGVARVGDRVIQLENDKELEVFNGDTGVVTEVSGGSARIRFGDREVAMDGKALQNVGLSYALTVHKSQGSEYQVVIMTMTTSHWSLLRRTLLYTGLTRAKTKCIIVGTRRALDIAIRTDDGKARTTTLAWRLRTMSGLPAAA